MKRTVCLIYTVLLCMFLLCACSVPAAPELLEFPGTNWAMTPEQVIDSLGLPADTALSGGVLTVENMEFFGVKAQTAEFHFCSDIGGVPRLHSVRLFYPDGANMAKVRKALLKTYGSTTESFTEYKVDRLSSGTPQIQPHTQTETEHLSLWFSSETVRSYTESPISPLRDDWRAYFDEVDQFVKDMPDGDKMSASMWEVPVVRLFWTDNREIPFLQGTSEGLPRNIVCFDAGMINYLRMDTP